MQGNGKKPQPARHRKKIGLLPARAGEPGLAQFPGLLGHQARCQQQKRHKNHTQLQQKRQVIVVGVIDKTCGVAVLKSRKYAGEGAHARSQRPIGQGCVPRQFAQVFAKQRRFSKLSALKRVSQFQPPAPGPRANAKSAKAAVQGQCRTALVPPPFGANKAKATSATQSTIYKGEKMVVTNMCSFGSPPEAATWDTVCSNPGSSTIEVYVRRVIGGWARARRLRARKHQTWRLQGCA